MVYVDMPYRLWLSGGSLIQKADMAFFSYRYCGRIYLIDHQYQIDSLDIGLNQLPHD